MNREVDLYKIGSTPEELQSALITLRQDFDAHNHDGTSSRAFETLNVQTVSAETILIRKTSYTDTASGIWMGIINGVMKLKLGTASSFLQWDGTALSISGSITATSGTIGGFTISATALTGGLIQTASSGNHVAMTGSTGSFDIYGSILGVTYLIGSIKPNLATIFVGPEMVAYNWNDSTIRSMIKSSYSESNGSGGDISRVDLMVMDDASSTEYEYIFSIKKDSADTTFARINITATRFDDTLLPVATTTVDIGSSTLLWDDLWIDEVHYNTLTAISDEKFKDNIRPICRGLTDIMQLQPKLYRRKETGKEEYGFIAQEVKAVMPELTPSFYMIPKDAKDQTSKIRPKDEKGDTALGINMSSMIAIMVKSLQELTHRIEKLEKK